jgi:hypothetical protein
MVSKVPVSLRTLEQRFKRGFARDGRTFHRTHGGARSRWFRDLGIYYATKDGAVCWSCSSIERLVELARATNMLKPHEDLAAAETERAA